MQTVVERFAEALTWIDRSRERFRDFRPGVGPYGKPQVVRKSLGYLKHSYPADFGEAVTKKEPDVLIPGRWALEFKIVRPFGDNGQPAEHWSQNLLHPYPGNTSALGDAHRLAIMPGSLRRGVIVFAYEHSLPKVDLELLLRAFELLARDLLHLNLGSRCEARLTGLVHPVHEQGWVYGWEVFQPN